MIYILGGCINTSIFLLLFLRLYNRAFLKLRKAIIFNNIFEFLDQFLGKNNQIEIF